MLRLSYYFLFFILISCSKETLFSSSTKILNSSWDETQNISFEWNNVDTTTRYDLVLLVKHTDQIPSQNVYVKCKSTSPDLKSSEQVVSLELLANNGVPFGSCAFGSCSVNIILATNLYFPLIGKYSLTLAPFSRINPISGIDEIGLNIEKFSSK
ncbi:MAG: hypothetical protein ABIO44_02520 [Saprospiraceae bacterium]